MLSMKKDTVILDLIDQMMRSRITHLSWQTFVSIIIELIKLSQLYTFLLGTCIQKKKFDGISLDSSISWLFLRIKLDIILSYFVL